MCDFRYTAYGIIFEYLPGLMFKGLAIFLISIHLMGNTEVGQLFKLPQLIHHYFQHQRLDPGIRFIDFLAMHYAGDDGTTADDDLDKKLPYHNTDHSTVGIVYSPMVKDFPVAELPVPFAREYNDRLQQGISSKHVLLIFQPPKRA